VVKRKDNRYKNQVTLKILAEHLGLATWDGLKGTKQRKPIRGDFEPHQDSHPHGGA
jgi:hypothetical protein